MENSDDVRLCSICQSFYGRAPTNFLCSSCFKKQGGVLQQPTVKLQQPATAQPAVQSEPSTQSLQLPSQTAQAAVAPTTVSVEETKIDEPPKKEVQTDTNKCWNCQKKVGLVQNPCKCGYVYCPKHRLAEAHNCTFDYFAQQQQKLAKENPHVEKDKLERIF